MDRKTKHLSGIANDVLLRCAQEEGTSVDALVSGFEAEWKPETGDYSRKLIEFCCLNTLDNLCRKLEEKISDGTFSRFTFDMMLAWEKPHNADEESYTENVAKETEDRKVPMKVINDEQDDIPLFYSDLMPLLVDNEPSVGEDAVVWLGTLLPLLVDVVNGRFTFETLTAPTAYRLHFPAYDKFLKEINACVKHLQKQTTPKGVEMADDEFILHVEGTVSSQRVVRHIGGTSWPGRLTLTNYALYFEASGTLTYEDAIKLDLSKNNEKCVKPIATGPWGAPLFDKAIIYESSDLQEGVVVEFPEMTSSTRRDHWLALVKEIMLLHQFISKYNIEYPFQSWELQSRTVLGIIRLHAAREMLRISPPAPNNFLIFALFDELPKGDYVLEQLAESLNNIAIGHPRSASSILRNLNVSDTSFSIVEAKIPEMKTEPAGDRADDLASLESAISQVREETKETEIAKATAEGLKEEGISDSSAVLMELLKPIRNAIPVWEEVLMWKRPATTVIVLSTTLLIVYKEWVGKAMAAFCMWLVWKMVWARRNRLREKHDKIVVCTGSDQTTVESIVSAQYGLKTAQDMVQLANIAILKIWSIMVSRAPKHADMVIMGMTGIAIFLAVVPMKFIIMGLIVYIFAKNSKPGKYMESEQGNRRLKEWWESIPVIPVEVVDRVPESKT